MNTNYFIVIILFFLNISLFSQKNKTFFKQESLNIYNDTINYTTKPQNTDSTMVGKAMGGYTWHIEEGLNRIWDTTGQLIIEGVALKKFKLGFRFSFRPGNYTRKVGLWRYFCDGEVIAYRSFDNKGRELSKITFYNNNQIHKVVLQNKYKKPTYYFSKTFFQDGREVITSDDIVKYIDYLKSKNNDCLYE